MTTRLIILPCHHCHSSHRQWPTTLTLDPSLTVRYRCLTDNTWAHHQVTARHASVLMNCGVPLTGVPDTVETIVR